MGDGGHQPGATGLALPPVSQSHTSWLKSPRVTVIRIEAYMAVAAVLLFLQLILGSRRRRSGGIVTQGGLWVAYTLSFPLITNTIGQMVSAPVMNALYAVWVVSLYHILGSTNSAVAYDLDDTKKWTRRLFEQFQYFLYSYSLLFAFNAKIDPRANMWTSLSSLPRLIFVVVLLGIVVWSNLTSILSIWMSNVSNPSKVVADYMKDLVKKKELSYNNYLVHCRDNYHPVISADSSYYISKVRKDGITMMSDIKEYCSGIVFLGSHGGSTTLTDICFSFSLFQLLKRRYFGLLCAEASTPEALNLFLTGFLPDDRGGLDFHQENTDQISERTFRIVEVQLGFLYDFFFTRYAFCFELGHYYFSLVIMKIILIILVGVFVYRNSISIATNNIEINEVKIQKADTITTLVVFGVLFVVEIVQLALYMASDWACVALACDHAVDKTNADVCKSIYSCIGFPRRLTCSSKYWKNEIGQYSILESGPGYSFAMMYLYKEKLFQSHSTISTLEGVRSKFRFSSWTSLCIKSFFLKEKSSKVLSLTVRKAILSTLQSCRGQLSNGESSLKALDERNSQKQKRALDESESLVAQFKWALDYESQAETMLVWHIATTYCEIAQSPEVMKNIQTQSPVKNIQTPEEQSIAQQDLEVASTTYCEIAQSPEVKNIIQTTQSPEVENIQTPEEQSTAQQDLEVASVLSKSCEIAQSPEVKNIIQTTQSPEVENIQTQEQSTAKQDLEVASVLSKYCAYLMAFAPELLTDPEADTKFIFATAVSQAEQIWELKSNREKYDAMKKIIHQEDSMKKIIHQEDSTDLEEQQEKEQNEYEPIIKRGVRLGKMLESKGPVLQWKVMANFWAEKLLYIAPSDNIRGHIEHLANGGEFLTHVWALLSNAGIIDRK